MRPDQAASIIIRPYVTENTFDRIEKENKLVFIVSNDSTKNTIILKLFKVNSTLRISFTSLNVQTYAIVSRCILRTTYR